MKKGTEKKITGEYDLTGRRFERLVVVKMAERERNELGFAKPIKWVCRCDCGKVIKVRSGNLTGGGTRSCGCLRDKFFRKKKDKLKGACCPFPTKSCELNVYGLCCRECSKQTSCKLSCQNSPDKCGRDKK